VFHTAVTLDPPLMSRVWIPVPALVPPQATMGALWLAKPEHQHESSLNEKSMHTLIRVVGGSFGSCSVVGSVRRVETGMGGSVDDPGLDVSVSRNRGEGTESGKKLNLIVS
jgi:hypothetical protein